MKTLTLCAYAAVVALAIPTFAAAGTVTNTNPANGTYYGNGNVNNNGWTASTEDSLELALGGIIRYTGPATEIGSDYYVPAGDTQVSGKSGPVWGFAFSIDANSTNAVNGPSLSDYNYKITVTDLTTNVSAFFNPLTAIGDNSFLGTQGAQNAENLSFPCCGIAGFDSSAQDTYRILLQAFSPQGGDPVNSVSIDVHVTPEPATFGMIGISLLGLAGLARKKLRA